MNSASRQLRLLLIAMLVIFGLIAAACGDDDGDAEPAASDDAASEEEAAPEEEEAAPEEEEAAPEEEEAAPEEEAEAGGSDMAAVAAGGIPEGGTEVAIEGDLSVWDGLSVGLANLAPVPGAERWSRPLQACLEENGATVDFQDVGGDPTRLTALLEGWANAEVDAVFNIGIDMSGQESLISAFTDAGTPFVIWGAGNPEGVVALDANQEVDGQIIADYVAQQIGGAGTVIMVNANNPALQSREAGVQAVFADYPDIELVVVGDALGFTVEAAQTAVESALQANPDAVAVIGGFGSLGVGAANAVAAAGSDAIVVSMNGDPEEYDAIRSGGPFVATVADGHEFGGQAACEIAASMIAGGEAPGTPGQPIFATSVLVTAENLPAEGEIEPTPRAFYQVG